MIIEYLKKFPSGFKPFPQQIDILKKIEIAFSSGKKFVICNAPTGSGKSMIAKTVGAISDKPSEAFIELINSYDAFRMNNSGGYINEEECLDEPPCGAFVLTITKALQDQYLETFEDTKVFKGKNNYICDIDDQKPVDMAQCLYIRGQKEKCWAENRCPYYTARNESILAPFSTINYDMFLMLPPHVKRRNVIICDEASELEDVLVKNFSVEIVYKSLKANDVSYKPLYVDDYDKILPWLSDIYNNVKDRIEQMKDLMGNKRYKFSQSEHSTYNYLNSLHKSLNYVISSWQDCEYVLDRTGESVSLTPLRVNKLSKHIFNHGDRILLLSATIIDHKHFAKSLGIDDYAYIEEDSIFDPAKSPIKVNTQYNLNYNNLKTLLPRVCQDIKNICDMHKKDKGIIHTHSQNICDVIGKALKSKRFLFRTDKETNKDILALHYNSDEATVLVSPSLTHGIDLKGDLSRFQIIVKAPFLPLGNKRIKKLFEIDNDWYLNKCLVRLVQAAGRSTRSQDDWCTTYILDGTLVRIILENKDRLPKYFLDRFQ